MSPHFDDAVLSVGGLPAHHASQGLPSLMLTFLGSLGPLPLRRRPAFHRSCGVEDNGGFVPLRQREEARALAQLEATGRHLDLPEALYRINYVDQLLYPVPRASSVPYLGDAVLLGRLVDQLARFSPLMSRS